MELKPTSHLERGGHSPSLRHCLSNRSQKFSKYGLGNYRIGYSRGVADAWNKIV